MGLVPAAVVLATTIVLLASSCYKLLWETPKVRGVGPVVCCTVEIMALHTLWAMQDTNSQESGGEGLLSSAATVFASAAAARLKINTFPPLANTPLPLSLARPRPSLAP